MLISQVKLWLKKKPPHIGRLIQLIQPPSGVSGDTLHQILSGIINELFYSQQAAVFLYLICFKTQSHCDTGSGRYFTLAPTWCRTRGMWRRSAMGPINVPEPAAVMGPFDRGLSVAMWNRAKLWGPHRNHRATGSCGS